MAKSKKNESIGENIKEAQDLSADADSIRTGQNDDMVPDARGQGTVSQSQRAAEEAVRSEMPDTANEGTVRQASQEGDDPAERGNTGTVLQASQEGDKPGGPNVGTVQQASQEGDKPSTADARP